MRNPAGAITANSTPSLTRTQGFIFLSITTILRRSHGPAQQHQQVHGTPRRQQLIADPYRHLSPRRPVQQQQQHGRPIGGYDEYIAIAHGVTIEKMREWAATPSLFSPTETQNRASPKSRGRR